MARSIYASIVGFLFPFPAEPEKYPTRTVEQMLAWMVLAWSGALLLPGTMLRGDPFKTLIVVAPEMLWGICGVLLAASRLVALELNGRWRRSPTLRFIGALTGMFWWALLTVLYAIAVDGGAPDFPMRYVLIVAFWFECKSAIRCGFDMKAQIGRANGP